MANRKTRRQRAGKRKSRRQTNNASWNTNNQNFLKSVNTNVLAETENEAKERKEWRGQFNDKNIKDVTSEVKANLPPGWRAYRYKNGNIYYGHRNKKNSQYEFPLVTRAGNAANLPEGWETFVYKGRNYYKNKKSTYTQWDKPTGPPPVAPSAESVNNTPPAPPNAPKVEAPEPNLVPRNKGEPAPAPNNRSNTNTNTNKLLGLLNKAQAIVQNLKGTP